MEMKNVKKFNAEEEDIKFWNGIVSRDIVKKLNPLAGRDLTIYLNGFVSAPPVFLNDVRVATITDNETGKLESIRFYGLDQEEEDVTFDMKLDSINYIIGEVVEDWGQVDVYMVADNLVQIEFE